jgi:hypothetical protein
MGAGLSLGVAMKHYVIQAGASDADFEQVPLL